MKLSVSIVIRCVHGLPILTPNNSSICSWNCSKSRGLNFLYCSTMEMSRSNEIKRINSDKMRPWASDLNTKQFIYLQLELFQKQRVKFSILFYYGDESFQ